MHFYFNYVRDDPDSIGTAFPTRRDDLFLLFKKDVGMSGLEPPAS